MCSSVRANNKKFLSELGCLFLFTAFAFAGLPSFYQLGNTLYMSNANVQIQYNLSAGTADFYWQNSKKIAAFYSGVSLNGNYIKGTNFTSRTWSTVSSNQVVVISTNGPGTTALMKQFFTLDQDNSFLVRLEMDGTRLSANWMGPLVLDTPGGMDIGTYGDNRALFVPFDNDGFVRYNAESINGSDVGNEVGAFYDNISRNGLVVGSVTHDTWKTGVYWSGSSSKLDKLNVYGGVTSHWTWDVAPHGSISGNSISSPTVFVGFGPDWRTMLENLADENLLFTPKLNWTNGVPFGWNSWGYYQTQIGYSSAIAVSDSIHTNLQPDGFSNNGTVYVNLDSYWDNMSDAQLMLFANHCHANGQKAGIYWSPFVWWGSSANASNSLVEGTSYYYSAALLRTASGQFETNDGALAMDLTHPACNQRIDYFLGRFFNAGFDYIKLDFLTHGALEGVHYNTNVTTGIQAYNLGMQYLFGKLNGKMFISESIAPLFPYQYAHSRRISCDANASRIANTEYMMNSVAYGWWLDRLYSFNDPDIMVFDNGADANENQSRLISGAVTGLFLDGDSLTNTASIGAAQSCLTNAAINALARAAKTFRTVEGNTGSSAPDIVVKQDGASWYVAVFNYTSNPTNKSVSLVRAGPGQAAYTATDLYSGVSFGVTNSFNVSLNAKQSRIFQLESVLSAPTIGAFSISNLTVALQGSGGAPFGSYRVLGSTNLMWPRISWPLIGTGAFNPSGAFSFVASNNPTESQKFYLLEVP